MTWLPIRKLLVGFATSAVIYGARRLGLDLGPDAVADAVNIALGYGVAYAIRDPRVRRVVDALDHSALAGALEKAVIDSLAAKASK